MSEKKLQDFSKEELIALCEKLENELKCERQLKEYHSEQCAKYKTKLAAIENILKI